MIRMENIHDANQVESGHKSVANPESGGAGPPIFKPGHRPGAH